MLLSLLIFVLALLIGYKWGYKWGHQVRGDEEWRKNLNHEPTPLSLAHDFWKKTQKHWHDFIDSLETEDFKSIKEAKNCLSQSIDKSFNEKVESLRRSGIYPKKK